MTFFVVFIALFIYHVADLEPSPLPLQNAYGLFQNLAYRVKLSQGQFEEMFTFLTGSCF